MKSKFGKLRWVCLVIVSLFLMEYLEPSTVGVRANIESPLKQERTDPRGPQSPEDGPAATPHAMLFSGSDSLEARLIVCSFRTDTSLQPHQFVYALIYRPPLATR